MSTLTLDSLRANLQHWDGMPVMPVVLGPLMRCLELPPDEIEIEKVTELIGRDASIAAQCLRAANAALFARVRPIETIRGAVVALGSSRLRGLLWASFLNRLAPKDKWPLDAIAFWKHSFGCAVMSERMAKKLGVPGAEKAYLCGLLHDVGEIVTGVLAPKQFEMAAVEAKATSSPLYDAEQRVIGFTHCETGRMLADRWGLPLDVGRVIEFHHTPERSLDSQELVAIVNLSDLLCRAHGLGYGYDEICEVDFAETPAWTILRQCLPDLDKRVDFDQLVADLAEHAEEIEQLARSVFEK